VAAAPYAQCLGAAGRSYPRPVHRPPTPFPRARVTIERHAPQLLDPHHLAGAAKHVLDVLRPTSKRHSVGLGVIANDAPVRLDLILRNMKSSRRNRPVTLVTIEPVGSLPPDRWVAGNTPRDGKFSSCYKVLGCSRREISRYERQGCRASRCLRRPFGRSTDRGRGDPTGPIPVRPFAEYRAPLFGAADRTRPKSTANMAPLRPSDSRT
jgi:hypothetical protein